MTKQQKNRDSKLKVSPYHLETQFYKGIPITLLDYHPSYYARRNAKRFQLGDKKYGQNIWIPNAYLEKDGTLKPNVNIDFVFRRAYVQHKFEYARLQYPL